MLTRLYQTQSARREASSVDGAESLVSAHHRLSGIQLVFDPNVCQLYGLPFTVTVLGAV